MSPKRSGAWLFVLILASTRPTTAGAQDSAWNSRAPGEPVNAASAVVERFQDELLSVMKQAEQLGYEGRFQRLAPAVRQSHDLAAIAQISVGRYWDELSEAQQSKLVDTFSRLSIATYAHRFDGYSGERFETQFGDKLSSRVASVHTVFLRSGEQEIRFDYILRHDEDGWRIVNIVVDGVSDLALKRSEYSEILLNEGFDPLISRLEEKIAEYSEAAD